MLDKLNIMIVIDNIILDIKNKKLKIDNMEGTKA